MMIFEENYLAAPISPFLAPVFGLLFQLFYRITHYAYVLLNLFVPKRVVPLPNEEDRPLIFASATELAKRIRQQEVIHIVSIIKDLIRS